MAIWIIHCFNKQLSKINLFVTKFVIVSLFQQVNAPNLFKFKTKDAFEKKWRRFSRIYFLQIDGEYETNFWIRKIERAKGIN